MAVSDIILKNTHSITIWQCLFLRTTSLHIWDSPSVRNYKVKLDLWFNSQLFLWPFFFFPKYGLFPIKTWFKWHKCNTANKYCKTMNDPTNTDENFSSICDKMIYSDTRGKSGDKCNWYIKGSFELSGDRPTHPLAMVQSLHCHVQVAHFQGQLLFVFVASRLLRVHWREHAVQSCSDAQVKPKSSTLIACCDNVVAF